jgi:hypothetical protein
MKHSHFCILFLFVHCPRILRVSFVTHINIEGHTNGSNKQQPKANSYEVP